MASGKTSRVCIGVASWYHISTCRYAFRFILVSSQSIKNFAELKELIAMHSSHATHGGDLKTDTVTIIGATLDLQEKVVKQVRVLSNFSLSY